MNPRSVIHATLKVLTTYDPPPTLRVEDEIRPRLFKLKTENEALSVNVEVVLVSEKLQCVAVYQFGRLAALVYRPGKPALNDVLSRLI